MCNLLILPGKKIDKENNSSIVNQGGSPPISAQLQELSNSLKLLCSSTPSCMDITLKNDAFHNQTSTDIGEPTTPSSSMRVTNREITSFCSPWEKFNARSTGMKVKSTFSFLYLLFSNAYLQLLTSTFCSVVELTCSRLS